MSCLVYVSLRSRRFVRWNHFGGETGSDDLRLQFPTILRWPMSCFSVRAPGLTNMVSETFSFGEYFARRGSWTQILTENYYFIRLLLSLFLIILRFCYPLLVKYRCYSLFYFHFAFYSLHILPLLISLFICRVVTMTSSGGPAWSLQFTEADLKDARERSELSLLARIFWNETRDLRYVENSFLPVWKCDQIRIFDVGYGLYQFIFPSVSKRNFVLAKQPWYYQRAIVHFTDDMTPSKELFDALCVMPLWVKIIGMPLAYRTIAVGRKLLEPMGEVLRMGYFDAHKPEGCYVKGRVRMDLFNSFLGTAPVKGEDGSSFQVFFQYEGVPCICYLCGYLGHVMGDCYHEDLVFDPLVRDSWICGVTDPDEVETEGPCFRRLLSGRPQARRTRGGLPPSVAAGLSSNLNLQGAQNRRIGGQARVRGCELEGPRPALSLPGPTVDSQVVRADAGKGVRIGPEPQPVCLRKSSESAGPSGARKGPSPLPSADAFPPAGSVQPDVDHEAAPPLASGLEVSSGLEAVLPSGPVPLVDASLSGPTKRKLEAEFEGGEADQTHFPPSP
ncbi:Uncharacterized protein At4g02000 [Linum perenne]